MTHTLFHKKEDIEAWLNQYDINNYILVPDKEYGYVVDVQGQVSLEHKKLDKIEVKFNHITGSFYCHGNNLSSLLGAPILVERNFECSHNQLLSLTHSPNQVGGYFNCRHNHLSNLQGSTQLVGEHFDCSHNQLFSLKYGPNEVGGYFDCSFNLLTSLKFCPTTVGRDFSCTSNQLASLDACPEKIGVGSRFYCFDNPKLRRIQKIDQFPKILTLHREALILKEKKELEQSVGPASGKSSVKSPLFKL